MKTCSCCRIATGACGLLCAAVLWAMAVLALPARAAEVFLWNRLGSEAEVQHSEFGPSGAITRGASPIVYSPMRFGNGLRTFGSDSEGFQTRVAFPFLQPNRLGDRGALAFWVRPTHDSQDGGIRRWINAWEGPASVGIYWRGWGRWIESFVCAPGGCISAIIPSSRFSFQAGQLMHVAMTWDVNGIEGSSDTIRAYVDGVQMGTASGQWPGGLSLGGLSFGYSDYGQYATVDNLVVWSGVKTDHSDRGVESPLSCNGGLPTLSALVTGKAGEQSARQWTVTIANGSHCPALAARIDDLQLKQTSGITCTPVRVAPAAFPVIVGDIPPGASGSGSVTFNFSGCAASARFSATIRYSANGAAAAGTKTLNNQFR